MNIRPEHILLLDSARTHPAAQIVQRIRESMKSNLNWDSIIETASWYGVLPLLCYNLNRFCPDAVPPAAMQKLQERFRVNSMRNLALSRELLNILQFLEKNKISAVAFKGPVLAEAGYGNLALRQFSDLDVLVKEEDFPQAKELFLTHDYRPWRELTPLEETQYLRSNHAYTLVRSQDGLRLDLHWRITQERYAFGFDVESLWSRLTRASFCGRDVLTMAPQDLLLVLCMHGSKHCWERLAWICDVAELIRANPGLEWDEILSRARALNIENAVILGLKLANELLDARLPTQVLATIRQHRNLQLLSLLIRKRLFARVNKPIGLVERTILFWMTGERLRSKIPHLAYAFSRVFIPNEHDTILVSLPRFIRILYYPVRLMRLTTARTRTIVGRLF